MSEGWYPFVDDDAATADCDTPPCATAVVPADATRTAPRRAAPSDRDLAADFGIVRFTADLRGRWSSLSEGWSGLTGSPADAAIGARMTACVPPRDRRALLVRCAPVFAGLLDDCRIDVRYQGEGGTMRWVSVRLRATRDRAGGIVGVTGLLVDVAPVVQNASRLAESEERYRLLAENSNEMIVRFGLDGVRRYVSPASRRLLGYAPEELVGKTPASAIHVEDRARVMAVCGTLLMGATDPMCVYRQERRDGSWAWLEATYHLIRDPLTNAPAEMVASVRDVSRREAAELAAAAAAARAQESARLVAMAGHVARLGHWRLDVLRGSLFWSSEVSRMHGVPHDHEPTLEHAISAYHPDDRAMVEAAVQRCIESGADYDFSARIVRPTGEIRHVTSRGQAERSPDGTILGLFGVIQDVTDQAIAEQALRASEARYRLLADNATDIIFRLDREERFIYVSPAVKAVTGFAADRLIGEKPTDAIHPEDRGGVDDALAALWTGAAVQRVVSYRSACTDGSWRWLEVSARRADHAGKPEVIGVSRDVSERQRIAAELVAARAAAEAAAETARILADTDELTALPSRRMFMAKLAGAVQQSARTGQPLSVGIFDIDHFKSVNDGFGHAAGDAVLRRVAEVAADTARGGDLVARIGGEEFAILMPGAHLPAAIMAGERMRQAVAAECPDDLPAVTISVGIAQIGVADSMATLLARADAALYDAKRSGRDRVCHAG